MLSNETTAGGILLFATAIQEFDMDKRANRVARLKQLVDANGGPANFARTYSQPDADKAISETFVSQILNGHRSFGEVAARRMAARAGLPEDYFDVPVQSQQDGTVVIPKPVKNRHALTELLIELMESVDDAAKGVIYGAAFAAYSSLPATRVQRKSSGRH